MKRLFLLESLLPALMISCAGLPPFSIPPQGYRESTVEATLATSRETELLTPSQRLLLEGAASMVGAKRLVVDGYRFPLDCTGTVQAIYAYAGIDIRSPLRDYRGNGVARLNAYLADKGLLYRPELPEPGDLIFWDDTYDRNGDGRWNDELTHVGMVIAVAEDGTVSYVHHNYRKGIVTARMNLRTPDLTVVDGTKINSAMRMRDGMRHPRWLASHLYRESGSGWRIEETG